MSGADDKEATAGDIIAGVVDSELAHQRDRETSMRQRGAMIVTASGGLVTLILAIGGGGRSASMNGIPIRGRTFNAGLIFFVVAALLGLAVNAPWNGRVWLPRRWKEPSPKYSNWVKRLTEPDAWYRGDASELTREIAAKKADVILRLRCKNDRLGGVLVVAILAVVVATACFALAISVARG